MNKSIGIIPIFLLLLTGCQKTSQGSLVSSQNSALSSQNSSLSSQNSSLSSQDSFVVEGKYETKVVPFYNGRKIDNGVITPIKNKDVTLRFYEDNPNVPYIGLKDFFHTFYKTDYSLSRKAYYYTLSFENTSLIHIDTNDDIISISNIEVLSKHPDFVFNNSKTFIKRGNDDISTRQPRTIDLKNYKIPVYGEKEEAYVPFTLISNLSSETSLYVISYNEEGLYEFDYSGVLHVNDPRDNTYYGSKFNEIADSASSRKQDFANFNYNLLCMEIDNFRGYTSQMKFIDNNVLSLGLNGTLETLYPNIKKLLLSLNRKEYQAGLFALFSGLGDGGHTVLLRMSEFMDNESIMNILSRYPDVYSLVKDATTDLRNKSLVESTINSARNDQLGQKMPENYYYFDPSSKVSYVGFNSFNLNYSAWNNYYTDEIKNPNKIPVDSDTYAFVRSKLYQALDDKAETVILDLSTNGGGDSEALNGLIGLFNNAKADFFMNNVTEKTKQTTHSEVDINLDGKFDDLDKQEAIKFQKMNIVVMTSRYSFSCGNLFPSLMKEMGYKIIGEQSGGGSCAIMLNSTADGEIYMRSSFYCLADKQGHNIDSGVEVTYNLVQTVQTITGEKEDFSLFFNPSHIQTLLNADNS